MAAALWAAALAPWGPSTFPFVVLAVKAEDDAYIPLTLPASLARLHLYYVQQQRRLVPCIVLVFMIGSGQVEVCKGVSCR